MRSFSSGSFGRSNDPWFRVGDVGVTTTIALTAMGVFSIFVYVAEGSSRALSKYFWLTPRGISSVFGPSVSEGGVWRLFTWPLFLDNQTRVLNAVILIAIFYMLGSRVEEVMGRIRFTRVRARLSFLRTGERSKPTRVARYRRADWRLEEEIDLEPVGVNAVFTVGPWTL